MLASRFAIRYTPHCIHSGRVVPRAAGQDFAGPAAREIRNIGRRGVSVQTSKFLLAVALTGMLGPAPARMFGQAAAAPASAQPQKNWKDRAEYDLFDAITKDADPKS